MQATTETTATRYNATEKCRAVLSVWTEQRTGTQICAELAISAGQFSQWQEAAMAGMLGALEPKWREEPSAPALPNKLKNLLEKKLAEREGRSPRLAKRLAGLAPPEAGAGTGAQPK
jgi:hypothetical protein